MRPDQLEVYVAIGDSMSIDRYPSLDLLARNPPPAEIAQALRRRAGRGTGSDLPIGAASLLARNADDIWPEFVGHDLASAAPAARVVDVTMDGATLPDVVEAQLPGAPETAAPALVTLTVGGNDLLMAYGNSRSVGTLERAAAETARDYERCVGLIRKQLPNALLVLNTVYDPSDETGFIPGFHESGAALPVHILDRLNDHIRRVAGTVAGAVLADVQAHFLGHGARAPVAERWYWAPSMIEPGARGASEIRRLWLAAAGFAAAGVGNSPAR